MKYLSPYHKKNFLLVIISLVILSCGKDDNDTVKSIALEAEDVAYADLASQLNKISAELSSSGSDKDSNNFVAASFDIRLLKDKFEIQNVQYLTPFEAGFAEGFSRNNFSKPMPPTGTIRISCEETSKITDCPQGSGVGSGMRQARCVGNAVKECLDSGGCAEVCNAPAYFIAPDRTISR